MYDCRGTISHIRIIRGAHLNHIKQPYKDKEPARPSDRAGSSHCKYYKPSSVPPKRPLSFIYDYGHPQPLATYPPTLGEQPLIVGIHGLATRKAYGRRTLLPPRWALTPPFHPYPPEGRRLFSVTLLHPYERRAVNSCGALCCSDFPLPSRAAIERTCNYFQDKPATLACERYLIS